MDSQIFEKTGARREALGVPYMRTVPLEAMAAGAAALEYGIEKYDARNWEKGLPWQQMVDSLKRHVDAFERRKDFDDDKGGSGLPQVCMIMASAMMLCASVIRGVGEDDRLVEPPSDAMDSKEVALWIKKALDDAKAIREQMILEQERTLPNGKNAR